MADRISEERRSYNMSRIKSSNTALELAVRRLIHGMGYRYRLHDKSLPGKPDIVFRPRRKVIFVHGCFWHQHPSADCADSRTPKSNQGYWAPKLERTKRRDAENRQRLIDNGWESLIVWECELQESQNLSARIKHFLDTPSPPSPASPTPSGATALAVAPPSSGSSTSTRSASPATQQ